MNHFQETAAERQTNGQRSREPNATELSSKQIAAPPIAREDSPVPEQNDLERLLAQLRPVRRAKILRIQADHISRERSCNSTSGILDIESELPDEVSLSHLTLRLGVMEDQLRAALDRTRTRCESGTSVIPVTPTIP